MKAFLYLIFSTTIFLSASCTSDEKEIKAFLQKKTELNYHIINDSIQYKIIETELKNYINRKICVYKNGSVISETPIYSVQKKILNSDRYFIVNKKQYIVKNNTDILISDYKFHHNNYKVERIDTVINKLSINEFGDISFDSLSLF